jgi:hypothetical protein
MKSSLVNVIQVSVFIPHIQSTGNRRLVAVSHLFIIMLRNELLNRSLSVNDKRNNVVVILGNQIFLSL